MPDWKQWIGVYLALFVGGIAAMHAHFVDYILVLLLALGVLGVAAYNDQKKLNEYRSKEMNDKKTP